MPVICESRPNMWTFECPGCDMMHAFYTDRSKEPCWKFNGDVDKPTFSPSLRVRYTYKDENRMCHSFVKEGKMQFLNDCTHDLAGQTVDLPELDED